MTFGFLKMERWDYVGTASTNVEGVTRGIEVNLVGIRFGIGKKLGIRVGLISQ